MASVTLDLIENGSVRRTSDGWQIQRVAHVSGLAGSKATILSRAVQVAGVPQIGDLHPMVAGATVTGHYATGNGGDSALVFVTYESRDPEQPTNSGGQPNFIVTDDTSLRTIPTQMIGGKPLRVTWSPDGNANNDSAVVDTLTINVEEQVQDVTLWGVIVGRDLSGFRAAVGMVNADFWYGNSRGKWRITRFADETQDRGRTYACTVVASRRSGGKVWCNTGILRHQDSGKFVAVSERDAKNAANAETVYPPKSPIFQTFNGILVAYPYDTVPFGPLLGVY